MKVIRVIMIVMFCTVLAGGAAAGLVLPAREYSVRENRELAQRPKLTAKKFLRGKYQKKYEAYLSDQFIWRDAWTELAAGLQLSLGRKDINGVWLGKEGYLIERQEASDFDREQVEENIEHLAVFLNEAENLYGKGHVSSLFVPSKAEAMPEYLPDHAGVPSRHRETVEKLRRRLSNPELLFSAEDVLWEHQGEYIYYRTDHHWTTLGACYAYAAWAEQSGMSTARTAGYYRRETAFADFYGTTYNKAHIRVPADRVELFHTAAEDEVRVEMGEGNESNGMYFQQAAQKGFNCYDVFFSGNTFRVTINTGADTGRVLLLIKDSFANCFAPFLTEDYEQIIMVDYRYGRTSVGRIMEEQEDITDVLVLFNTERFMQDTGLDRLADVKGTGSTMEEFNMADFEP